MNDAHAREIRPIGVVQISLELILDIGHSLATHIDFHRHKDAGSTRDRDFSGWLLASGAQTFQSRELLPHSQTAHYDFGRISFDRSDFTFHSKSQHLDSVTNRDHRRDLAGSTGTEIAAKVLHLSQCLIELDLRLLDLRAFRRTRRRCLLQSPNTGSGFGQLCLGRRERIFTGIEPFDLGVAQLFGGIVAQLGGVEPLLSGLLALLFRTIPNGANFSQQLIGANGLGVDDTPAARSSTRSLNPRRRAIRKCVRLARYSDHDPIGGAKGFDIEFDEAFSTPRVSYAKFLTSE